ncbi:MAG TPA: DNA repair ATPase [Verrucomicrobiae bacterium]
MSEDRTKKAEQAEVASENKGQSTPAANAGVQLDKGTYEIIRQRLSDHGAELRARLQQLNAARQEVFGSIKTTLLATDRVTTENKCVPRDMVAVGKTKFIFGYNVHIGLKAEVLPADVFSVYELKEHKFHPLGMELLSDSDFQTDFKSLYRYYKNTTFAKFSVIGPNLFMVFQVGKAATDIKTFKWLIKDDALIYQGNRSDHEFAYPPQIEFEWKRTHRDLHRSGLHPHISIEDRLFVETVHGDLTIKIEDNTATGEGIYSEPVENKDQTLDDAEIYYALVGNIILLKIRPYQEKNFRFVAYNEKLKQARRLDGIQHACVLLPDAQGIIFSRGYYLQTGEFKEFEANPGDMMFERRVQSPNGEDHLYVFYNRERAEYVLMPYNIIEQRVETPVLCDGFSFFENGEMALFKATDEPQKHHAIQIWQTPFVAHTYEPPVKKESPLFKIGNADLVHCMAECQDILVLLAKDDSYGNLYVDLVKSAETTVDSYFWIGDKETFDLKGPLVEIRNAARSALEEFDKVVRLRRSTAEQVRAVTKKTKDIISHIPYANLSEITLFVNGLAGLRAVTGEIIALRELRYVDLPAVEALEKEAAEHVANLSQLCVEFLLKPEALQPYQNKSAELHTAINAVTKVAEANKVEEQIVAAGNELQMLIDVVTNLKIEDTTVTTSIVERISGVYATLNQARALLRQRRKELLGTEATAEFASQVKLLEQGLLNYLDLCDTPEKCGEYQTKLMVQVEELEGKFADFEDFVVQLSDKRNDIVSAFESRKVSLIEARHKRANALLTAADRILKGIQHRLASFKTVAEINGYYASDLMVEKIRSVVGQLGDLGDSGKAGDIQSRLKSIREEAVRQLKDRQELFVDGQNVVQLGKHKFSVNTQELGLTMVLRDEKMFYHLAGTNFFEEVTDADFLATSAVWAQEIISENRDVYRGEYLVWKFYQELLGSGRLNEALAWTPDERLASVQQFMAPRFAEGYVKGVHDADADKILGTLLATHHAAGLLRYPPAVRACGAAFWTWWKNADASSAEGQQEAPTNPRLVMAAKLRAFGMMTELFPNRQLQAAYLAELRGQIGEFLAKTRIVSETLAGAAAEYLFQELMRGEEFVISKPAADLANAFGAFLKKERYGERFASARKTVECDFASTWHLLHDWVEAYVASAENAVACEYLEEATCLLMRGQFGMRQVVNASLQVELSGLIGNHSLIQNGNYKFELLTFLEKMRRFDCEAVPQFQKYEAAKHRLMRAKAEEMRLESFKPKVLTSFVRNKLIDTVFLPMIGDNLAKQIGVAGENKRTDLMGMLLLVSPPGYGKTTLMEYIASRLGLVFVKVNGPALGEKVTAIDPAVAPNSAAREEIQKLNLALEMGDNVMLMIDDIQHCNPEFLQKFISLCDAQRKIEGVYAGRTKTYDLRGRKFVVVMAGNPYTESGEKFKIPDMLANRADTYNLGDIVGNTADAFKMSYLENALTSNPVLNKLASKSQKDLYGIIQLAEIGPTASVTLEANYSAEEIEEMVAVMKKLIRVREVILKINSEYIRSAAQADLYRTEPPFKLQGSYRNMNRLAEKVVSVMNDAELETVIDAHYKNEAQTLATGAEANLLKYRELLGKLTPDEKKRWEEIKRTFTKTALLRGSDERDPVTLVVQQLSNFSSGLDSIRDALSGTLESLPAGLKELAIALAKSKEVQVVHAPAPVQQIAPAAPVERSGKKKDAPADGASPNLQEVSISPETLQKIWELLEKDGHKVRAGEKAGDASNGPSASEVVIRLLNVR